ncbi:hypothetical protein [Burkholderia sp. SRS-W-2-2016]|uniref:hypothetical protein n=1 Tax=Burkholderia sp. SRS-W-2-2016 TaxID=1926878 RepID=UPI002116AF20|nr:hypothetical protein [Burkholderia sp. SRS-W-2-2016]
MLDEGGFVVADGASSWVLPPQPLSSSAVAALRANASVVFFGESILSPDLLINAVVIEFLVFGDFYSAPF